MMRVFALIFTGFSIFCVGCAAIQPANQSPHIQGVEDDKFSARIKINGHEAFVNPFGGTIRSWFIRTWIDKQTHEISHQLYVEISYSGEWKFFETASDDTATALKVTKIDSHVGDCSLGSCTLDETLGIELSDAALKARAAQGYSIKLYAKSGDALVLDVLPVQIQLQLAALAPYAPPGAATAPATLSAVTPGASPAPAAAAAKRPFGVKFMKMPFIQGVLIVSMAAGSVAENAGLHEGDTIYDFDGRPINATADLQAAVNAAQAGATITVKAHRKNEDIAVKATF